MDLRLLNIPPTGPLKIYSWALNVSHTMLSAKNIKKTISVWQFRSRYCLGLDFFCLYEDSEATLNLEKSVKRGIIVQDIGYTVLW